MRPLLVKQVVLEHKHKHLLNKIWKKYHNSNEFKFLDTINNKSEAVEGPGLKNQP